MLNSILIEGHQESPVNIREVLQQERDGLYTTISTSPIRAFRKNYKNNAELLEISFEEIATSLKYIVDYLGTVTPYGDLPETKELIDEFDASITPEQRETLRAGYSPGDNLIVSQPGLSVSELADPLRTLAEKIALSFVLDRVPKSLRNLNRLAQHMLTDTFEFTEKGFPYEHEIFLSSSPPEISEISLGGASDIGYYLWGSLLSPPSTLRQLQISEPGEMSENIYLHTLLAGAPSSETLYTLESGLRNKRLYLQGSGSSPAELLSRACEIYGLKIISAGSSIHVTYPYDDISLSAEGLRSNIIKLLPRNVQETLISPVPPPDNRPKSKLEQLREELRKSKSPTHSKVTHSLKYSSLTLLHQEIVESRLIGHACKIEELSVPQNILLANFLLSQLLQNLSQLHDRMPSLLSRLDECMLYLFDIVWKDRPARHFSIFIQEGTNRPGYSLSSPR